MRLQSSIDLAIALVDVARRCSGVESVSIKASRQRESDSRYVHINNGLGNHGVIRLSAHPGPADHFGINIFTRSPEQVRTGLEYGSKWIKDNYGPEIQTTH